jgi:hypothetical protein
MEHTILARCARHVSVEAHHAFLCTCRPNTGCPIDHGSNIFRPGDINAMFERWLEEAGQDTGSLSADNLPTGGKHPFGQLNVVTSPYHDMMQYVKEDEEDDPETFSPIPWIVSIDGFLCTF